MTRASRGQRVLVIGGGMFGLTAALELLHRGHAVELADAGSIPNPRASSTDLSKAVRMDYGTDRFYSGLAARALDGWRRWNLDWGQALFHEVGILMLQHGRTMREGSFELASFEAMQAAGVPVEPLDQVALSRRFPLWAEGRYRCGYFNPWAGWVESGLVVGRLVREAIAAGLVVHENRPCVGLLERGAAIVGARFADGGTLGADRVLLAAGAWTPHLLPDLLPRMWATGQPVLQLRPVDAGAWDGRSFPVWCGEIATSGWYGFPPNAAGLVKLGNHGPGRRIGPGEPLAMSRTEERPFLDFIESDLPALRGAEVVARRICLYCDSWNGDFLIDRDPGRPGLTIAAGGSGHGFKFAPVLGRIIADVVEGRANLDARRFAWNEPGPTRAEMARWME